MLQQGSVSESYRWLSDPSWHLWEGGFLLIGRADGLVPAHAHHALQIVIALDGMVKIRGEDDEWHECHGLVVKPDVVHSFNCNGANGAMIFVDPESDEGVWLQHSFTEDLVLLP